MSMEFSFEMKIEDWGCMKSSCKGVLDIGLNPTEIVWFSFALIKSAEESKYYLPHRQLNGLGRHLEIRKSNPMSFSNNWKKEFPETVLKTE